MRLTIASHGSAQRLSTPRGPDSSLADTSYLARSPVRWSAHAGTILLPHLSAGPATGSADERDTWRPRQRSPWSFAHTFEVVLRCWA